MRVGWLVVVLIAGIVLLGAALLVPARKPGEVDRPDATVGGPPVSTSGTVISAAASLGGREDLTGLIGERIELEVDIGQAVNDVAFWAGDPPDRFLVVLNRGTRSGIERQLGLPSRSDFAVPPRGRVTLRGVVEPIPYAEAMYSWMLTRRDVSVLQDRGAYVLATEIVSVEPHGAAPALPAEAVDEFSRETAPPPGEQVETPLEMPPPSP